jgi:hypothetical protein
MSEAHEIRWEWWKHPLGGGAEYSDDPKPEDGDFVFDDDGEVDVMAVRPVIPTAGGLVPLQVYGNFSANFDFWIMHTNFNLSKRVVDKLIEVPGVETCDVITRYRARIGFAKCFKSSAVKAEIGAVLGVGTPPRTDHKSDHVLKTEVQEKVNLLKSQAEGLYSHWAIYVIPNGEISFIHSDDQREYEKHLDLFLQAQQLAGGKVLTSHDR